MGRARYDPSRLKLSDSFWSVEPSFSPYRHGSNPLQAHCIQPISSWIQSTPGLVITSPHIAAQKLMETLGGLAFSPLKMDIFDRSKSKYETGASMLQITVPNCQLPIFPDT
jgi:hypothetical protein